MANFRPSNILKNIEDSVTFAAGSVGRKAGKFGHDVKVEFRARQIAAEARRIEREVKRMERLSYHEAQVALADQMEILGRAQQLLRERKA